MHEPFPSAVELAAAVASRDVSPLELVEEYLSRIDRVNPRLNAFCEVRADEARDVARRMTQRLARRDGDDDLPRFFGVPIGIKDLHPVAGWRLCHASNGTPHPVSEEDSPAVKVLRDAGFVFLGATTSPEFGTVSVTESARHGVTRNPWDPSVSSGGSSGGSAAAVASGMLPIGHASDGAGSIREPASHCGLVGLKPSRLRVPSAASWTGGLTTEGVLTRTVTDTAAVLDRFATAPRGFCWYPPPAPPQVPYETVVTEPPRRLRVGLNMQLALPSELDPSAKLVVTSTADLLADLGHEVVEVAIPGLDPDWLQARFETLYTTSTAYLTAVDEERLEPLNREMRRRARETDSLTFVSEYYALQLKAAELFQAWDGIDVMLTPTNPVPATPEGRLWDGVSEDPMRPLRVAERTAALTVLANALGLPALSLPLFTQPDGMPLGVQLIGQQADDATVLALGRELELARPWHHRRPAISVGNP